MFESSVEKPNLSFDFYNNENVIKRVFMDLFDLRR